MKKRKGQPTAVLLPGESQGEWSLPVHGVTESEIHQACTHEGCGTGNHLVTRQ